jgi:hypothetical protein
MPAYTIKQFCERNGIGLTKAYEEIHRGRLVARKVDTKTLIVDSDERAWIESLPRLAPEDLPSAP